MGNKVIEREDILERHAPWLNEISVSGGDCSSDNNGGDVRETLPQRLLCKVEIMQCETLASGWDNRETEKLKEIFDNSNNKHFYKEPTINRCLSLSQLQLAQGDAFHFIGHSLSLVDGAGAIIVRENKNNDNFLKLSDIDLSLYLGTSHSNKPLRLIYLSMCDKFSLACMLMSTLQSSGNFYVVCWHKKVSDRLAYDFSEQFYSYCAYNAFDVEKAFDTTVNNILLNYSEEERKGCYPCLLRQVEIDGQTPSLLRANWKMKPEVIDRDIIVRFDKLCSRDLEGEIFGSTSKPFYIMEGDRNWHDGNQIGDKEKDALGAIGFITSGHTLTGDGNVADIDSFWHAQVNFDTNLWPATAEKPRRWPHLWNKVLPKVILQCTDISKINACRQHLQTAINLRRVDFQQKSNSTSLSPDEQIKKNRSHQYMIRVMKEAIQAIDKYMATIDPNFISSSTRGGGKTKKKWSKTAKTANTVATASKTTPTAALTIGGGSRPQKK